MGNKYSWVLVVGREIFFSSLVGREVIGVWVDGKKKESGRERDEHTSVRNWRTVSNMHKMQQRT